MGQGGRGPLADIRTTPGGAVTEASQTADQLHIYLSSNVWDGLWIIQQPVAREISRTASVLYVERFVSVFTVLRYPSLWRRLFSWLKGPRQISPTLRLLAPLPLFHLGHRFPRLFRLEFVLQRWWIERCATRRGRRILWMDNPLYQCAVGEFDEDLSVYHVADEISAFPTSDPLITDRLERAMLAKVDVVFAAAEQLSEDKRRWQPHTHTIWNAIDASAFGADGSGPKVANVEAIPTPRVAFVGVVDEWVDLELLYLAATRLPQIHFAVVGPVKVSIERLRSLPNVHFLGRLDRSDIPGALRRCSASLVPFRKTKLTARIVPLKVFEALAAGILPVCTDFSMDLATLERDGHARVGRTSEEFVAAIQAAVAADSPAQRTRLADYGRRQTWEARWQQMAKVLEERL